MFNPNEITNLNEAGLLGSAEREFLYPQDHDCSSGPEDYCPVCAWHICDDGNEHTDSDCWFFTSHYSEEGRSED